MGNDRVEIEVGVEISWDKVDKNEIFNIVKSMMGTHHKTAR